MIINQLFVLVRNYSRKKIFNKRENGATCRDRTDDLMITNQLLYQLS